MQFSNDVVLLQDQTSGTPRWLLFNNPTAIVQTNRLDNVIDCLATVEAHVEAGRHAAGFISYEASPAMDCALQTYSPSDLPLIWFLICDEAQVIDPPFASGDDFHLGQWEPSVSRSDYRDAIAKIKSHIRDGDTYQVNYTIRLRAPFAGDPWRLFLALYEAQRPAYSAFVQFDGHSILSISPELFFSLKDEKITCTPMKGTAKRGLTTAEDKLKAEWLYGSEKNRAENVMIVDMIRNDIGSIAETGSVKVDKLFTIETYPTVQQMTSTVSGTIRSPISQIVRRMFPCASITGAPKAKTMEIIKNLEPDRRGIYTGSIGYMSPGGRAQFNVAIRTVLIDHKNACAEYGVGSGIVWDSDPDEEYDECQTKAAVLKSRMLDFDLLESILWRPNDGLCFYDLHMDRLRDSANYFSFSCALDELMRKLDALRAQELVDPRKVRVTLSRTGEAKVEAQVLGTLVGYRVHLASCPTVTDSPFVRHKTTYREHYRQALNDCPGAQDVILWNSEGFVTESCVANVVIEQGGAWLTPPEDHGLLPGVFRRHLLNKGIIEESPIRKETLLNAERFFLINSVRGWMTLVKTGEQEWTIQSEGVFDDLP